MLRSRRGRSAISSTWRSPITASAGGNVSTFPPRASVSLPPAEAVTALWEVDEVARTRSLPHAACAHQTQPIISETCPPGEGDLFRVNADTTTLGGTAEYVV